MRRELGRSFRLVRIAWVLLVASLAAGLAVVLDIPFAGVDTLFGLTLIVGWLLTFLLGILQRIVPFLASMHAPGASRAHPHPRRSPRSGRWRFIWLPSGGPGVACAGC